MEKGLRKSPSESALALCRHREADSAPASVGDSAALGNKRQALAPEVLGNIEAPKSSVGWTRLENGKPPASKSWQSSYLGLSGGSPSTLWDFPTSSDSETQASTSCTHRSSDEGEAHCRRSLESSSSREGTDNKSEADHFELNDSALLADSLLNHRFSVNLGISYRKSLLNSLSEREAAQAAQSFGGGLPCGAVSPSSPAALAQRRCISLLDTTLAPAMSGYSEADSDADETERCVTHTIPRPSREPISRTRSSDHVFEGQAAAELFLRLNHARQTVAFVQSQAARFSRLDKAVMNIWEALDMLRELREYESALMARPGTDPSMPLLEHAFQTAEACRVAFPHDDWLHLVGLIHSLGKLLGHPRIAGEPQWAICGESFPVGCRFDPGIAFSQFFSVNPDRRSRIFNTPTGSYKPGGGLASVYMSWSGSEYLYMLLLLNRTLLPPQALFIIRYQKFLTLEHSQAYRSLMCKSDHRYLPWLAKFRDLSAYKKVNVEGKLSGEAFGDYYRGLLRKYIPNGTLRF